MTTIFDKHSTNGNLKFVKIDDHDKYLKININVQANHDIEKMILNYIEMKVNELLIKEYEPFETYKQKLELQKTQ